MQSCMSRLGICYHDGKDVTYENPELRLYYKTHCQAMGYRFEFISWGDGDECNEYGYNCTN